MDVNAIIDTGACVSCVDETLVSHHGQRIHPVGGVSMKTATEEPVTIVGRTYIMLEISQCVIKFPVFVARNLGNCCILGNDFHVKYKTMIDFGNRLVTFTNVSGRNIRTYFHSKEREARFTRPPPDPSWLNQIQLTEEVNPRNSVMCAEDISIPPKGQRLLKIEFTGELPETGVLEQDYEIFREKSLLVPYSLMTDKQPESVLVINLANTETTLRKGEVFATIHDVEEIKHEEPSTRINCVHQTDMMEDRKLDVNPQLGAERRQKLLNLLHEFRDRFAWDKAQLGETTICEQDIQLTSEVPVHQPPYRVSHRERQIIQAQVSDMEKQGVVKPSRSAYASPVVLVRKKNNEWRFCVDYRKLNELVKDDPYPLPLIQDILSYLNGCQWFTTLDMNAGYWQIPIKEEDQAKTAFITPDGLYEFRVMPFGLKTSPAVFQRCMDRVLSGLKWGSCMVYLDDVLVMAPSFDIMLERLKLVLERLRVANMTLNPVKCKFGYTEVRILGHKVGPEGICPDDTKIQDVQNFGVPRRLRALRSFLGLCNYYRQFVPNFSMIVGPLTRLTRKNVKFEWGHEQQAAFQTLKDKLTSSPVLRHFNEDLPVELHTDASDDGVGASLMQREGDELFPVSYASRRLSDAEKKYTTTEKECIAVVWATQYFRQYLWGRQFTVVVDHHALCWLSRHRDVTGRLGRWALKLMEFQYEVKHKQGKLHVLPDCLSRNPSRDCGDADEEMTNDIPMLTLELKDLARLQQEDPEVNNLRQAVMNPDGATSSDRRLARSFLLEDDILYKRNVAHMGRNKLVVVPKNIRDEVLYECHDSPLSGAHLGFSKTFSKIKSRFYWENMLKDTKRYVKTCLDCQTRKSPKVAPSGLLQPIPVGMPFERLGIDVLGPFTKTDRGNVYIIVTMDYATKWAEAKAVPSATAEETAQFIINQIICKFGCPKEILSDRGQNFRSNLVSALLNGLGIRTCYTTAYHPACNGLVEHFNGTLAQMLSHYVSTNQKDWDLYVGLTCFSYNTSIQETTRHTPFYLVYGREARLPIDVAMGQDYDRDADATELLHRVHKCREDVVKIIGRSQQRQKQRYDKTHRSVIFEPGDQVLIWTPVRVKGRSTKLLHRWHGPYKIVAKLSEVNYEVEIKKRNRQHRDTVHVSRLKKYYARQ